MNKYKKCLMMLVFVLIAGIANPLKTTAQILPDGACDPLDPSCPIDGGISLLIAAGIGLGAKRALSLNKKEEL